MLYEKISLKQFSDERGRLTVAELGDGLPFLVKRIYFLTESQDLPRGYHAHHELRQLVLCLHGSCDMVFDNGRRKETVHLDNPCEGVILGSMIWREMHNFTRDCVLLVLADQCYDEKDYIRNYDEFLRLTKGDPA